MVKSLQKMHSRSLLYAVLIPLLVLAACVRPDAVETYVLNDGTGRYIFSLDMGDSLSVYDLSFYTRVDDRDVEGFPMTVTLYSPSGEVQSETVWFDCRSGQEAVYRTDCEPQERGVWQMSVRANAEGLRGIGLICRERHGTR